MARPDAPRVPSRVVVTGAQGLLGRHVVAALLGAGAETVLGVGRSPRRDDVYTHDVSRRGTPVPAPVPDGLSRWFRDSRYAYVRVDLADADAAWEALGAFRPDVVVHAAAALRDSPWDSLLTSNVRATIGVLDAAVRRGTSRVVLVSSGSVYGAGAGRLPLREDGPAEPLEPYGVTKRTAEDVARVVAGRTGMSVVSARVFNLLGPGLQEQHLPALLAGHVAWAQVEPGHRLRLGPLEATRDFVDVRDAAEAIVLLAGAPTAPPVVNVASGIEVPVRHVLEQLLDLAGRPELTIDRADGRPSDVPRAVADVTTLGALGHRAGHCLTESLRGMLTYYESL